MLLRMFMKVNNVGEPIEAFSIRSFNCFIVIRAFFASLILCVENLKLKILPLRASQKINEF